MVSCRARLDIAFALPSIVENDALLFGIDLRAAALVSDQPALAVVNIHPVSVCLEWDLDVALARQLSHQSSQGVAIRTVGVEQDVRLSIHRVRRWAEALVQRDDPGSTIDRPIGIAVPAGFQAEGPDGQATAALEDTAGPLLRGPPA